MAQPEKPVRVVGRYSMFEAFATGGMATVHLGHMVGSAGFSRVVAIKRMKPEIVHDVAFATMFLDEASLAARVVHPNVVTTLDVIRDEGELMIVMEYVRGVALREIMEWAFEGRVSIPLDIALSIIGGVLEGLHAAHGTRGDDGELLGLIHRDISPHNILVGRDGIAKIVDFGIAKAVSQLHVTATHEVRGKVSYLSPERILQKPVDLRCDVFSSGVVLWEMLGNRKRYAGDSVGDLVDSILTSDAPLLSAERPEIPAALDRVVRIATARAPDDRYPSAEAMLTDLERVGTFASKRAVASWLAEIAGESLSENEDMTRAIRTHARPGPTAAPADPRTSADPRAPRPSTPPSRPAPPVQQDTFIEVDAVDDDDDPKTTKLNTDEVAALMWNTGERAAMIKVIPPVPTPIHPQATSSQHVPRPRASLAESTEILKTTKIVRSTFEVAHEDKTVRMLEQRVVPMNTAVFTRRPSTSDPMTRVGIAFVFIAVALAVLALILMLLRLFT